MNHIEDERVRRYKDNAIEMAGLIIQHLKREFPNYSNYMKGLILNFESQLNEIEKIREGRVK